MKFYILGSGLRLRMSLLRAILLSQSHFIIDNCAQNKRGKNCANVRLLAEMIPARCEAICVYNLAKGIFQIIIPVTIMHTTNHL